jgi:hypothetical protein
VIQKDAEKILKYKNLIIIIIINQKIVGSIPNGVTGLFLLTQSFQSHYGPGVDSASNRNEYQKCFLGVKAAGAQG